jgi:spermidine/putrescine transport system substrate-binding protein
MLGQRFSFAAGFKALAVSVSLLAVSPAMATEELNALVWCDHTDPALIEPFEKANDVKVNLKVFEGTGAGLSLIDQSQPGDWDVMVIDSIDVARIAKERFLPLADDALPLADQFPEVRMDDAVVIDGKRYAVTDKWGFNAISYNKKAFSAEDVSTLTKLTDPKFKGRIAIYDYYLPVLGMASVATGTPTKDLTAATLPAIKELMLKLKANAKLVGEVVASQTAIATGEVDVVVGAGEWVTAGLHAENPDLDFVIPEEGGILWSEAVAILKDSKKPDLALKFIQHILSPEGQAALSTSSCFWGMPAQKNAALTDEQKETLKFSSDVQAKDLAASNRYPAPDAALDKQMQDTWNDILQAD